ncbi:MAG: hypothetical protein BJ554DRAFT_5682 [Olpidium bornovanus]|uniref:Uncharacterized protein n=1 Tax=Olpidium bornovanus TaxID=278681 RepID=A0A8H8DKT4_9FUNG|nr:MAG: hypothetical protein BJ554DRAFT_5682 [Olpidium bornovanus]
MPAFSFLSKVLGMALACYNILLLPLDVANQRGQFEAAGGIPMRPINIAFFFATVCGCLTIVPFTIFYYEGVDDSDETDDKT